MALISLGTGLCYWQMQKKVDKALAFTPPGEFGDLPNCGKASNRGLRPFFGSGRSAWQVYILIPGDGKVTFNSNFPHSNFIISGYYVYIVKYGY